VCSGGIGNLIDRFCQHGEVTDFLNIGIGSLRTGIFNVADFALLMGVALILFSGARYPQT
jgi:signal peptidase II